MSVTLTSSGITFSDGTTRSARPLTTFASGSLTSSINSSSAANTDTIDIQAGGGSGTNRGIPAVYVSFDYWTYWGSFGPLINWYVTNVERHVTSGGNNYIRVQMFHGANGGAHVYSIKLLGHAWT